MDSPGMFVQDFLESTINSATAIHFSEKTGGQKTQLKFNIYHFHAGACIIGSHTNIQLN